MVGPTKSRQQLLRQLPSVDALLNAPGSDMLLAEFGRALSLEGLRNALAESRDALLSGELDSTPSDVDLLARTRVWLEHQLAPTLYPVINATGIIVHTNLGRAPLSESALSAVQAIAAGYSNLEYDTEAGERGSRTVHTSELLKQITGAEDALVVNNNAAAVLLMLTGLCGGGEVVISRGQLVEIGGGFRVPDIMAQSGARLVEVGTTNRTHLSDYELAITPETAAILVAHHSNYKIIGFTSEPSLEELAELARARNIPLLFDQGSGALLDVSQFGLESEPTVSAALQAGADLAAFSGDKLLGGPQAGILCGRGDLVRVLKRHPLARAMRADKLCLAALSATLTHYLRDEALDTIPVWQMIGRSLDEIDRIASDWVIHLGNAGVSAEVLAGHSRVGGGSLPGSSLPTKLVAITVGNAELLATRLRQAKQPVIARIQDGRLLLDPRTVLPWQAQALLDTLMEESARDE